MNAEQEQRAEKRGYGKGYAAGKRRRAKEVNAEHRAQRDAARFDRFMCAAITGLLACQTRWSREGKANKSAEDFASTAATIATKMMTKAPRP